ncbi:MULTISPECIES: GNAT family N-acetyltransferase [Exiguobacterium]|uniref:GNAT family N-acetyltransferase n=1 Tax=Exiguobacterium TaxID=33986 RepID=UPI0008F9645D|nr:MULTISPECIES: GNAT family N-acetyltransferase [Exiguobacterium]MCT4779280.1 GNAT family N-acetyltransferase [Exiguobacterium soli]OIN67157.1 GNAT family N-acetyltransferase [Exiguobacterium sp. KRL4]
MIRQLESTDYPALYHLQQQAYQVEADLIGASHFPPLQQTEAQLRQEQPSGYVCVCEGSLVGILTLEQETITRLIVSPDHFRQGIAKQLVQHVLTRQTVRFVSTAAANHPAIALYQQFGFRQTNQQTRDAIVLVTLERS